MTDLTLQTNHWPKTGTLLFIGPESSHDLPYAFAKEIICNSAHSNGNLAQVEAQIQAQKQFQDRAQNQIQTQDQIQAHALFSAGTHPDFQVIKPEQTGKVIKIEQIRDLYEWTFSRPSLSATKVAIFDPADAMTVQAANALLKTLEEPSFSTLFILVTARPHLLLPTIRSRCYTIRFREKSNFSNSSVSLSSHMSQTSNSPQLSQTPLSDSLQIMVKNDLQTLSQGQTEPVKLAASWLKKAVNKSDVSRKLNKTDTPKTMHKTDMTTIEVINILNWIIAYLHDEAKHNVSQGIMIRNKSWWSFLDRVLQAKQSLENRLQVNPTLLLETLLIQYARMFKDGTHNDFAK